MSAREGQDAIRTDEVEFFVTNHQWLENDSLFADLVLPVTTCLEDNDAMGAGMVVSMRHSSLTPAACDTVGESKSDFTIACEIGERFGVREQIDLGMTEDEWFKYAFDNSRLPEEISWDEYQEKGYYFPKLDPNWKDLPAGMRPFYEDPEANPLDTPTGKLEFWSQALADNFPDDKERTPMSAARQAKAGRTTNRCGASAARSIRCSSPRTPADGACTCRATTSSGSVKSRRARSRARTATSTSPCGSRPKTPRPVASKTATS